MTDEQKQQEELRIQRELKSGKKMIQKGAYLYLYENGLQIGAPINITDFTISPEQTNKLGEMVKDYTSVPVSPEFIPVDDYRDIFQKSLQEGVKKQQEQPKSSQTIQQEEVEEAPEGGPIHRTLDNPVGNIRPILQKEEDIAKENLRLQEEKRRIELERKKKQQLSQ